MRHLWGLVMSAQGMRTLIQHLTHPDSLEVLAKEGLDPVVIPHEGLREVYAWAMSYYHDSLRSKAPSVAAIRASFPERVEAEDIDLEADPEDSVYWAIQDLKDGYAYARSAELQRAQAQAMASAAPGTHPEVISYYATEMIALSALLQSKTTVVDLREGMAERFDAYLARAADGQRFDGMRTGFGEIDGYTYGIHPGELAVIAGAPKSGKSFALVWAALAEWRAGRAVVLYTMENSVDMTLDRLGCLANQVNYSRWQRGLCSPEEVAAVRRFVEEEIPRSDVPLWVEQPQPGRRTAEHLVREAAVREADSLLIDQLTFMEPPDYRRPRHEQIREITHSLKSLISSGRRMPCILAHQLNRSGEESASRVGRYEMRHLAEGCFDDQTEIMCDRGWVLFRDLPKDAKVATLEGGRQIVYQQPTAYIDAPYRGDLYTHDSSGLNFAITPNHRLLVKNAWQRDGQFRFEKVEDLTNERYVLPRWIDPVETDPIGGMVDLSPQYPSEIRSGGGRWTEAEDAYLREAFPTAPMDEIQHVLVDRKGAAIPMRAQMLGLRRGSAPRFRSLPKPLLPVTREDFAAFVGIWLSEGKKSQNGYAVKVTQTKPSGVEWIDALFTRLEWDHRRSTNAKEVEWVVHSRELRDYLLALCNGHEASIPEEIFGWGREAMQSLLEGLMVGDGSFSTQWQRFDYYTSSSKRLVDGVQRLILHLGMTGNVKKAAPAGTPLRSANGRTYSKNHQMWKVRVNADRRHTYLHPRRMIRRHYDGRIYCVTVPNSTILVRRGGVPMWSGNSEVERTADWGFALYRSRDMVSTHQLLWQTLFSRRERLRHFRLMWDLTGGYLRVNAEVSLDD